MNLAIAILMVIVGKVRAISCERRVLTRITAVEHFDSLGIPVLHKSMVTIETQSVSFAVVVFLNLRFCMITISCFLKVNILDKDRGRVWLLSYFFNIFIKLIVILFVP